MQRVVLICQFVFSEVSLDLPHASSQKTETLAHLAGPLRLHAPSMNREHPLILPGGHQIRAELLKDADVKDSSFTRLASLATLRHQSSKSPFCYLMPPYLHLMLCTTCPYHGQVNTPFKAKNHLLSMSHRTDRAKHSLPGCTCSAAPPFRFFLHHVAQSD
jgi:hypothetical protein